MSATQSFSIETVQHQLQAHLQAQGQWSAEDSLALLAHGEANLIFRLNQDRLVRVAVNTPNQRFEGDFSRVTAFEATILRYLNGTGIGHELLAEQRTPSPDFPYTYLITNYLAGGPVDYSRRHLQGCAATLARLHRLPLEVGYGLAPLRSQVPTVDDPLQLFFQEARDYAQPYLDTPSADPAIVEMIQAVLAQAEARLPMGHWLSDYPHQCLVHSDHTYENWVVNERQASLIDWEWAEIGSPAGDLGHFLSPVTIRRCLGYRLPAADRQFFLDTYYDALGDDDLAEKMRYHFAAFGPFPAVRSLCWTAGYWVTARRWYADAVESSASAAARMARFAESQRHFLEMGTEVLAWLAEPVG